MKLPKKIYYSSENDEVVKFNIKKIKIDKNYKYLISNPIMKFVSWFTYRIFATPFAFITFKIVKRIKFHNVKVLKKHKKGGYFIYANHTNQFADGFCPALITFPKKPFIIANSDNVAIPILGKFTKLWGALPIPDTMDATKNFYFAIEKMLKKNNPIVIYPEAYLWPFYTKIRNFPATSLRFPIKYNKPVYTFTTVYSKHKHLKKPKIDIYVDGPFYPDEALPHKQAQENLREIVFNSLSSHAKLSDYEFIKYIQKEE